MVEWQALEDGCPPSDAIDQGELLRQVKQYKVVSAGRLRFNQPKAKRGSSDGRVLEYVLNNMVSHIVSA